MDYDADGTLGVEAELVFGGPGLYHPARRIMPPDGEEDSLRDLGEKLQIAVQRLHNLRVVAIHVAAQEMISELPPSADKDLLQHGHSTVGRIQFQPCEQGKIHERYDSLGSYCRALPISEDLFRTSLTDSLSEELDELCCFFQATQALDCYRPWLR